MPKERKKTIEEVHEESSHPSFLAPVASVEQRRPTQSAYAGHESFARREPTKLTFEERTEPFRKAVSGAYERTKPATKRIGKIIGKEIISPSKLRAVPKVAAVKRERDFRKVEQLKRKWYFSR